MGVLSVVVSSIFYNKAIKKIKEDMKKRPVPKYDQIEKYNTWGD